MDSGAPENKERLTISNHGLSFHGTKEECAAMMSGPASTMADEGERSRRARECENHAWQFRELEQKMMILRNESHIPNNPGYLMLLNFLIQEYAMSGLIKSETFDTIRAALKKDQGITLD